MAADAPASQARYRVLRGIVHHPGGVARPGDIIALLPQDGDPLCTGPAAVLAQAHDHEAAPPGKPMRLSGVIGTKPLRIPGVIESWPAAEPVLVVAGEGESAEVVGVGEGWQTGERPDDAPLGEQIDGLGAEPIAPAPKRRRKASP